MAAEKKTKKVPIVLKEVGENVLLSIQGLRVWFELRKFGFGIVGHVHAVDGVDFDLHYGEAIAVVGESGCGKTSLMKTILGLYQPTEGTVVFDKKDLSDMGRKGLQWYRSQVGYVQQDPFGALPPFMNVRRILEEPLIIGGVKSKEERTLRITKVPGGRLPGEVPAYVVGWATAACGDRTRHDPGTENDRGRRTGLDAGCKCAR
jgi:ABC-type glutathione transport system ATPase component